MSRVLERRDCDVAIGRVDEAAPSVGRPRPDARHLETLARRLGVGVETLEHYLRAHGAMPDAGPAPEAAAGRGAELAAILDEDRALALVRPVRVADAPWVKRDRPRYFIAG